MAAKFEILSLYSTRRIDANKFEKYCNKAYAFALNSFKFCNIPISVHRIWAHAAEKMRSMGNVGLGIENFRGPVTFLGHFESF